MLCFVTCLFRVSLRSICGEVTSSLSARITHNITLHVVRERVTVRYFDVMQSLVTIKEQTITLQFHIIPIL